MAKKRTTSVEAGISGTGAAPARDKRNLRVKPATPAGQPVPQLNGATSSPSYDQIARLAYSYWEARGCQGGSPEDDWLRAEQELRGPNSAAA